jgi:hypothetical protein
MDYLKKVVPKMFQNTLSNLSTPVIQQFLDELSFREMFGHYPLACFDALLARISAQTQVNSITSVQLLHPRHSAVLGRALLQGDVRSLSTRLF